MTDRTEKTLASFYTTWKCIYPPDRLTREHFERRCKESLKMMNDRNGKEILSEITANETDFIEYVDYLFLTS